MDRLLAPTGAVLRPILGAGAEAVVRTGALVGAEVEAIAGARAGAGVGETAATAAEDIAQSNFVFNKHIF